MCLCFLCPLLFLIHTPTHTYIYSLGKLKFSLVICRCGFVHSDVVHGTYRIGEMY